MLPSPLLYSHCYTYFSHHTMLLPELFRDDMAVNNFVNASVKQRVHMSTYNAIAPNRHSFYGNGNSWLECRQTPALLIRGNN